MKALTMLPGLDLPALAAEAPRRPMRPRSASGRAKKGYRVEPEIAALHAALGIRAVRVPLSGALAKRLGPDFAGDLKIHLWGEDAPATAEVKARATGGGFVQLERWLGNHDLLILKRNNLPPLILLPWSTWARLIRRGGAMTDPLDHPRLQRGAEHLNQLGARATAEFVAELAARIGGLPAESDQGPLAEFEARLSVQMVRAQGLVAKYPVALAAPLELRRRVVESIMGV